MAKNKRLPHCWFPLLGALLACGAASSAPSATSETQTAQPAPGPAHEPPATESEPSPLRASDGTALAAAFEEIEQTQRDNEGLFDREAASRSLKSVSLEPCNLAATTGGHVLVTFEPSTGRVSAVVVDGGPLMGTPAANCVEQQFRSATVPPFSGGSVKIGKSFGSSAP